jgi:formylglycine-generating enzyme required for sulfatase activity
MKAKLFSIPLVVFLLLVGCTPVAPVPQVVATQVSTLEPAPQGQDQILPTASASPAPTATALSTPSSPSGMVSIPIGVFQMGDHYGFVDPQHPTDELPLHDVIVSAFWIGKYDITVQQYADYLNAALAQGLLTVNAGNVTLAGGNVLLYKTSAAYPYSTIGWDGSAFSVLDSRGSHPITGITWTGAAAYANWLSIKDGYQPCYDTTTWECDFSKNGYRLPTEAEWEYAARGGQTNPYYNYPWGTTPTKPGPTGPIRATLTRADRRPGPRRSGFTTASCTARATSAGPAARQPSRPLTAPTATGCTTWPAMSGSGPTTGMPRTTTAPARRPIPPGRPRTRPA